jgi:hypothetical protein
MRGTARTLHVFIVLVALLLATQPLLHNHPLDSGDDAKSSSASSCAICATGVGRLPSATPSVAAPVVVLYTIASPALPRVAAVACFARSSRAPPAV